MVLGIDLNDGGCQITYFKDGMEMPEPLAQITGREAGRIPMALAAIKGKPGDWYFGDEALSLQKQRTDVCLVDGLLSRALADEIVVVFGRDHSAFELLFTYLGRLLSLTSFIEPWQGAERICISALELGADMVRLLKKIADRLDYPTEQVDFIGRSESFYEFVMHQPEELWNRDVVLLDCTGKGVYSRRLFVNRKMRPAVCRMFIESDEKLDVSDDDAFRAFCENSMEGKIITSVFIAGEQVTSERCTKTLRYLCMKRRVFYGHAVYSKGAALAAMDRAQGNDRRREYLYLGKDKLTSNVGLRAYNGTEEAYLPLVDAGINWYDVRVRKEIYLGREKELRLLLTPLTGRNEHYAIVRLSDFPTRPEHTTRVRVSLSMDSEDFIRVTAEDLGFGEIFPSSGVKVSEEIAVTI